MGRVLRKRIVVTASTMSRVIDNFLPSFEENGWDLMVSLPSGQGFSGEELAVAGRGARAMIIGDDEASETFFSSVAPDLELLVKWGVGTDTVDFGAAEKFGVRIRNTPGAFSDEVADLALAYVLELSRNLIETHFRVMAGEWYQQTGRTLSGKALGLIGFGSIGRAIAHRALAFGMSVVFHDPHFTEEAPPGCEKVDAIQVFKDADFVLLACPSTPDTRGIVNRVSLATMKPSSAIVNVARGDLVVERDLAFALSRGRLSGAALDVYQEEPLPASSPLRNVPNVIFGAHNGSNTVEGLLRASSIATQIVLSHDMGN